MEVTLSILIPIYNFNCIDLVETLHHQALENKITFEIICLDDASTNIQLKSHNKKIATLSHVVYQELSSNIGRSRIRNMLATLSTKEFLLFLDCDSGIHKKDFLSNYVISIRKHPKSVIYGGTLYEDHPPKGCELHWYYGKEVESPSSDIRNSSPYHYFKTNNFSAPKSQFFEDKFDETILNYGYEDNVYSNSLKTNNIEIWHIDNSVVHYGLDKTEDFLKKIELSLATLKKLELENKIDTRLTKVSKIIRKSGLKWVLLPFKNQITYHIKKYLVNNPANITLFQIWKLFSYVYLK